MIDRDIFEDLFVLEMANNHLGSLERGLKIVAEFAQVVRFNNVRATIKLQFRDVDSFIHKEFTERTDLRYIKKTLDTRLTDEGYATLVKAIRKAGFIATATPFDERSVDLCSNLGIPIIKIASSDLNDWVLIEKIAKTKKPASFQQGDHLSRTSTTSLHFLRIGTSHSESIIASRSIPRKIRNWN